MAHRVSRSTGIILVVAVLTACTPSAPEVIRVGAILDLTGATSDISTPYAAGIRDAVVCTNQQGGINGRRLELIDEDYGYNIERAMAIYTGLVEEERVLAIMGWGTGDTEALRPRLAADHLPFMSASYSEDLTNINTAPYNFLIGVTYSDQVRITLQYVLDSWDEEGRPPRVAFLYNDTRFGLSPIQDGRDYAAAHGMELVNEQVISLSAIEVDDELQAMAAASPDVAIVQETPGIASLILLTARRLALPTRFVLLNWAADEKLIALSGDAAEGVLGTVPFAFMTEETPGIEQIRAFRKQQGAGAAAGGEFPLGTTPNIRYVQGWVTMQVMAEGIRRAADDLTGEGVRRGLESLTELDTGGITAPISFSSTSHRGATALRIYQVQDGRWVPITGFLEARR